MTIFYPDLSHWDAGRGVRVQPGTVAVIAKATHGTAFVDSAYTTYRAQAAQVGAVFGAYHWLNHGNAAAQARFCRDHVGTVPVMVDAEDMPGNTGYAGPLTVADIAEFITALRAAGGVCHLVYLPRWYWRDHMGSPDLSPLVRLGVGLVQSDYGVPYSDTGRGWQPFGGMTPAVWQYTDAQPYSGSHSDFNAFRGTVDQFRALISGGDMNPADVWNADVIPAPPGIEAHLDTNPTWSAASYLRYVLALLPGKVDALAARLDALAAAPTAGAPTQDQVDTAVAKVMSDPAWLGQLAAAIASHVKVV